MTVTAVVGAQWGDEAKGKFVDLLADDAEIVARFNGGDNAGHTVVNAYGTFKIRLLPNGFSSPGAQCVIGPGVVVNLRTLLEEVQMITGRGLDLGERLWLSPRCHVVLPYHPMLEQIFEQARAAGKTGTTGRGMGPVFADKVSYNGIRLADLADEQALAGRLAVQLAIKNPILQAFGMPPLDARELQNTLLEQFEQVRRWVREPFGLLQSTLNRGGSILLEGAQAALLDNDWGTYPFCTASNTLAGGAAAGLGIAPRWIGRVLAVAKAYTTRVGAGPMPTELHDETGDFLSRAGQEVGTVTGRPRRCGWFDAAAVRFTSQLNGATGLALTKLDVLDGLPELKLAVGYRDAQGAPREYWEGDARWLSACRPEYVTLPGWQESTRGLRRWQDLPPAARAYVKKVEELVGAPVDYVSTGPERDATISRR